MAECVHKTMLGHKLLAEFVGTFFLCLTVAVTPGGDFKGLAIGVVLMCMIYAGGHKSGAHYNPAVTVACFVRGVIHIVDALAYIFTQSVAAFCAAAVAAAFVEKAKFGCPTRPDTTSIVAVFVVETVATFALATVVLNTATSKAQDNNSYYGLAIGFTVVSAAYSCGPYSGGAFNPAVGLLKLGFCDDPNAGEVWAYWIFPILGGASAGAIFRITSADDFDDMAQTTRDKFMGVAPYIMEFIGTFMLCFTVAVVVPTGTALAGLSIGSILMVMVYACGATSGAHLNPAVTVAVWLRSHFSPLADLPVTKALLYIFAQLVAAAIAGGLGMIVVGARSSAVIGAPIPYNAVLNVTVDAAGVATKTMGPNIGPAFMAEIIGTFALCYVVLNTATLEVLHGNSFFGLAIGMTVTSMAYALGPISGGAFNPSVGLLGLFQHPMSPGIGGIWIYFVACPLGAALAFVVFRLMNPEAFDEVMPENKKFMHHTDGKEESTSFNSNIAHADEHLGAQKSKSFRKRKNPLAEGKFEMSRPAGSV